MIGVNTLLVQGVSGFMQRTKKRFAQIVFSQAGRNPAVAAAEAYHEWMGGFVEAAPIEGHFKFDTLPAGDYEVFAQARSRPTATKGVMRTATAREWIKLGPRTRNVTLRLSTIRLTIRGRITDVHGKPIAGAKVTAIFDGYGPIYDQYLENHAPPTRTAVSNADGSYELREIDPMNWFHLAGYLYGGKGLREHVDIHVEADGFVQDQEDIPEVPLVGEDVLNLARRLLKVFSQVSQRSGRPDLRERKGLIFPSSKGNTITDIDVVLQQASVDDDILQLSDICWLLLDPIVVDEDLDFGQVVLRLPAKDHARPLQVDLPSREPSLVSLLFEVLPKNWARC